MTATTNSNDMQEQVIILQAALQVVEAEIENLQAALITARAIGDAIGIIMTRSQLTYEDAFELMSRTSQHRNRKLGELAENVLLTGAL